MPRRRAPKPQAPKRPHLGIKKNVKRRKDVFFSAQRYKRERRFS